MREKVRKLIELFYIFIIKPILFRIDPEKVHDKTIYLCYLLGNSFVSKKIIKHLFSYQDDILRQNILGIEFKNPLGLAAGFDKNGEALEFLQNLGFGFIEIGSITGFPCEGNPPPRLWRLPKSNSLIVFYGLKNKGAEEIYQGLKKIKIDIPLGISLAKTNSDKTVDISGAIEDYLKSLRLFKNLGEYLVLNVSCPNIYEKEKFCQPQNLDKLLSETRKLDIKQPIFLKISPDLSFKEVDEIVEIAKHYKINGFIISNLTKNYETAFLNKNEFKKIFKGKGGLSGKAVWEISNRMLEYVFKKTKGEFILIGTGGIFSGYDAYKKIKLGASLVQLITGMIFKGPQLIGQINYEISKLLKKDGFKNIKEAIGANVF